MRTIKAFLYLPNILKVDRMNYSTIKHLKNKVAVVTGASSGIGRAVALRLATEGMNVVAAARREDKLKELESAEGGEGRIIPVKCDMTQEKEVKDLFEKVKNTFNGVHVLINNAGVAPYTKVLDCETERWRNLFELNVIAVGTATREAVNLMHSASIDDGYIINVNTICGHGVPDFPGKHMYSASKHALRIITEGMRQELIERKSNIRVSAISPGNVSTEIGVTGGWKGLFRAYEPIPILESEDIANTVVYLLSLPPKVNVADMVVRPTGEKFIS